VKHEIFEIGRMNIEVGENVQISASSNLYGCKIGDNVFIGPFVEIQKNTKIGSGTRVHSHTFICEFVDIGENVFIGHGVIFTNDLLRDGPARGNSSQYRRTYIDKNVSIGSNSTVLPVRICADVVIGAGSVVTKDITKPGIYSGNPAKKHE
jgi:acetyltransferase-like isoleucine patch superfamily enzyme